MLIVHAFWVSASVLFRGQTVQFISRLNFLALAVYFT